MKLTKEEDAVLLKNPDLPLAVLAVKLPGRSVGGIKLHRLRRLKMPKRTNNWTADEIEILKKYGPVSFTKDLVPLLPRHSLLSIESTLSGLGIHKTSDFRSHSQSVISSRYKPHYKLDQTITLESLDNATYQILIGSMLGDGGVHRQNLKKARLCDGGVREKVYIFAELHGMEQYDYVAWKRHQLKWFQPSQLTGAKPSFCTPSHPIFGLLRNEWYDEQECKKAYIPLKYIERLDELGLLIWYLDDGCRNKWSPLITSTLFSKEDIEATVDRINRNLGLSLHIRTRKKLRYGKQVKLVVFSARDRDKIMPVWNELALRYGIPDCMRYKLEKPT